MATKRELRRQDHEAALARLEDYRDGIEQLCNNASVDGHAAEVFLAEADAKLAAAIVDLEHSLAETEHRQAE